MDEEISPDAEIVAEVPVDTRPQIDPKPDPEPDSEPKPEPVRFDHVKVLDTPIDKGDYIVKAREFSRIHVSRDGFTLYFQEAGGETAASYEWTEETKAAAEVFKNL